MSTTLLSRFAEMRGLPPEQAKFYWSGGPVEVAPRTWFASMFSGVTGFETDAGLVLVDSGLRDLAPALNDMLRQRTASPVHTAVFTQGHVDHAFGLRSFLAPEQAAPRVIAHEAMPARFERYKRTDMHNRAINARQFGGTVELDSAALDTFQAPEILPDELYEDRFDFAVGGLAFEVHHCRGETDDHSFVWCPSRRVLCPGDLFIWGVPNAGNPQKVQRYPWDWAAGLRKMASLAPRSMCPGHGGPVVDEPERIQRMLIETAEFLETVVERTIQALNEGSPPHVDIVHRVEIPTSDSPWLNPIYDEAEFIVRNIIRYFGGWWTGRPSELKPAAREIVATEIADLCGGALRLLERAQELAEKNEWRAACHFADYALEAAPSESSIQDGVARIYEQRAAEETSLMATNLFLSAASYARKGRPFR